MADAFIEVKKALVRRKAAPELVQLAERAVDDEYRHAELSRIVASRFHGSELDMPQRLGLEIPKHAGASRELRDHLFVVGQCVLNETTASAFLECCLAHARGALATVALKELLSDEIDHGRLGWAHLSSLPREMRKAAAPWILPMAYLNLRTWMEYTPEEERASNGLAAHGAPDRKTIHDALVGALADLIIPGLKELAIDSSPIEKWVAAGASIKRPPVEFSSTHAR